MSAVLKIKNQNGEWVEISVIVGPKGEKGLDGQNGKDGKTPVLGVDYYTEADKQSIVDSVIAKLIDGDKEAY